MGKKDPATVPAPDPREVAQTDAEFNRIDQITPYGSLTYSGPNRNIATLNLNPQLQANLSQQLGIDSEMLSQAMSRLGQLPDGGIDLSQFGPIQGDAGLQQFQASGLPEIPQNLEDFRTRAEDAFYNRSSRLLGEQFEQQERSLLQRLANQGLSQRSDAYNRELDTFGMGRNRGYADLADSAVMFGGNEASRLLADALGARGQLFGEQFGTSQYNNNLRQLGMTNANAARTQGLNEALQTRGNEFNELAAFLGLQQVATPQLNSFFAPGQVDVTGANQLGLQANMFNANQRNQMNAAGLSGLYGMGSTLLTAGGAAAGPGQSIWSGLGFG